jgi:tetratricopeptide (TPR) repeat protein
MKLFTFIFVLFFIYTSPQIFGMEIEKFNEMIKNIKENKLDEVEKFIESNKTALTNDPEYNVILINFSLAKRITHIQINKETPKENELVLKDLNTGEIAGSIGESSEYDEKFILATISRIKIALKNFSNRLDIRIGLVVAAERVNNWKIEGEQLVDILKVSVEIDNKWTWGTISSIEGDPKTFMLDTVQNKLNALFNAEDEKADLSFISTSEALIKYYPKNIYGYSNLGVIYLAKKDYDKAKKYLQKALEIDGKDEVVLGNLKMLENQKK